jgi:hypothetical protein
MGIRDPGWKNSLPGSVMEKNSRPGIRDGKFGSGDPGFKLSPSETYEVLLK